LGYAKQGQDIYNTIQQIDQLVGPRGSLGPGGNPLQAWDQMSDLIGKDKEGNKRIPNDMMEAIRKLILR
jgi:hypothetical protein